MKILFIGDILGRSGREALQTHLPTLQTKYDPDIIIVNGDNAAHGKGISEKICKEMYEWGVDIITGGDHIWDQREIISYISRDPNLLRPLNLPHSTPGQGSVVFQTKTGKTVKVIHVLTRVFMPPIDCPFKTLNAEVTKDSLGGSVDAIFVDCHGEATSEKMALGHHLSGKITGLVGSHTHIPTADAHIMAGGTAYMTDAGMTGDFDSVIGVRKDIPLTRFIKNMPGEKFIPASGEATLCGAIIEVKANGLANAIYPIRMGGILSQSLPEL
jgi:metallophosphoesterase (TIGR00282 family)